MNWKTWIPLVLAIVLGVVAAKLVRDAILKKQGNAMGDGKFTQIVVTKGDIEPGRGLTAEDLALAKIDSENVPTTSFKTVDEVVGRVSETIMVKGQPVVEAMLAPTGTGSGLQALVPPGMRAVTMEVNEFSGVAGLLNPGCRVDIIATINDGGNGQQLAKTIVQNVKVTAVGQKTSAAGNEPPPPGEMFKSVTVLASLEDSEAIELACSTGRPRLVLRGGRDNTVIATAGVTLGELKGSQRVDPYLEAITNLQPPATQPVSTTPATQPTEQIARRETPKRTVRVIRAGVESNVTLDVLDGTPENTYGNTDLDPFSK